MEFSTLPNQSQWIALDPFGATRAYETLFSRTGIHHVHHVHKTPLEILTKRLYVVGFDLTSDREADEEHISKPRQGNMHIKARFKKSLPETVNTFCMLNSQNTSKLTTLGTLWYNEYHSNSETYN